MPSLDQLNRLSAGEALSELSRCCGSSRWSERMVGQRPFANEAALYSKADEVWTALEARDWLEAFSHHPRIGDLEAAREKWAKQEQGGVAHVSEQTLRALADGNQEYEKRFGHIFLICATGKSADEMLAHLRSRLGNSPERELQIAAEEQRKITRIRLEKWLKA